MILVWLKLFGLRLVLFTISIKAFKTVLLFSSFKGLSHACLVKTSMTHIKYLTSLFFEDNDFILAKSAAQKLSLNLTYTFLLLNVLVTGLWNSSTTCSFKLIPDPFFFSKIL